MRKLLTFLFALLLAAPLFAQIDTAKWYPVSHTIQGVKTQDATVQ